MAAYWIGEHKITAPDKFEEYIRQVVPMIERFGGRYLTRPGTHRILENPQWEPDRIVIVEFPDMAALNAWYHSPEYQPLIALRQASSIDVLIVLDGI
ncbi:MAG TPA: DUF1330 domain-containing protein [Hyphomicrobiales bacterium]|nr:DUF1330 domain-containing protein [Hyphomicrobiales bacterium]